MKYLKAGLNLTVLLCAGVTILVIPTFIGDYLIGDIGGVIGVFLASSLACYLVDRISII